MAAVVRCKERRGGVLGQGEGSDEVFNSCERAGGWNEGRGRGEWQRTAGAVSVRSVKEQER